MHPLGLTLLAAAFEPPGPPDLSVQNFEATIAALRGEIRRPRRAERRKDMARTPPAVLAKRERRRRQKRARAAGRAK